MGPVPRRVDGYVFSPLSLPKKPAYAKDPQVKALGDRLLAEVMADTRTGLPDPWARLYAIRDHPYFSPIQKVRRAFPGLGIALVAFGVYLGLERAGLVPKSDAHH